jgi:hypothetical protein
LFQSRLKYASGRGNWKKTSSNRIEAELGAAADMATAGVGREIAQGREPR